MNLRPLHDRVLVKRLEEQETKRGGIIIPDSAKEKPQHAEVIAVGSGKLLEDGTRATPPSRPATRSCSASTPAPTSGSMATSS